MDFSFMRIEKSEITVFKVFEVRVSKSILIWSNPGMGLTGAGWGYTKQWFYGFLG